MSRFEVGQDGNLPHGEMYNLLMRTSLLCCFALVWSAFAQPQRPNVGAQREGMKKLAFLVGTWTGDASTLRPNQTIKVKQTEEVSYKLDGLVLLIEGTGRNPDSGEVMFRALATFPTTTAPACTISALTTTAAIWTPSSRSRRTALSGVCRMGRRR
jgi:hypothetical protein